MHAHGGWRSRQAKRPSIAGSSVVRPGIDKRNIDKRSVQAIQAVLMLALLALLAACSDAGGDNPERGKAITTAEPAGGKFNDPFTVALSCDDQRGSGCVATYFTMDGSEPTEASTRYTGPITIQADTTLRYFSVDDAGNHEVVVTQEYIIERVRPQFASSTPAQGSANLPLRNAQIRVVFNEEMDPASFDSSSFSVNSRAGALRGTVAYEAEANAATFTLTEPLSPGNPYTVKLSDAITDVAGNALQPHEFNVRSAGVAWFAQDGALVKISSAQEELTRIDAIDCQALGARVNLAVDENSGAVWVVDTEHNRVIKLDEQGELLTLTQLTAPVGLSLDPADGSAWVAVQGDAPGQLKLVRLTTIGTSLIETQSGIRFNADVPGSLNPLTWNPNNNSLWVVDGVGNSNQTITSQLRLAGKNSQLKDYDITTALTTPSGTQHQSFSNRGASEMALVQATDPAKISLWSSAAAGQVQNIKPDGSAANPSAAAEGAGFFHYLSAEAISGAVWAADREGRVVKFAADGQVAVNQAGFSAPMGDVAADPIDGGAWIGFAGGLAKLAGDGSEQWRLSNGAVQAIAVQAKYGLDLQVSAAANESTEENGTRANPFRTIQAAIDVAQNRDAIHVAAGTYNEGIRTTGQASNLKILGEGANNTTITGVLDSRFGDKYSRSVLLTSSPHITFSNFGITSSIADVLLECNHCDDALLRGLRVEGNRNAETIEAQRYAIFFTGPSNEPLSESDQPLVDYPYHRGIIENNVVVGNDADGIYVLSGQAIVRNNIVSNNWAGVVLVGNDNVCQVSNNTIVNNDYTGLTLRTSNVSASSNIIANNHSSLGYPSGGLEVDTVDGFFPQKNFLIRFNYNNVTGNTYAGNEANFVIEGQPSDTYGQNTVAVEPQFLSPISPEYRLDPLSTLINAGPENSDFDAAAICDTPDRRNDLGAYGGMRGNW